ncbi:hypothetical protein HK405_013844 [Cladochytrium tenue]|nr:hypothetical protein HK405_013844 [Cladochytrium tenue]
MATKIYTLPNIEIPEAFYKLREQAKCHLQSPSEYATGLDVINNTNLMYFSNTQKAEFWTLKGIFLAKLNLVSKASEAFATAGLIDTGLAKAWAAWGQFNDKLFKEQPKEIKFGKPPGDLQSKAAQAIRATMVAEGRLIPLEE